MQGTVKDIIIARRYVNKNGNYIWVRNNNDYTYASRVKYEGKWLIRTNKKYEIKIQVQNKVEIKERVKNRDGEGDRDT